MTRQELNELMKKATTEVQSWPDWKKVNMGLLGHESMRQEDFDPAIKANYMLVDMSLGERI